MCGIAGLLLPQRKPFGPPEAEAIVRTMMGSIRHRGPDGDGLWSDPDGRCVLGQQRLAIIDTSTAGLQPFVSGDGRWWITFNGEIYNFNELRPRLAQAGVNLRGRTDTEVLIESVALWGASALERLDGMFAFAAFDTRTGETILARDPFGEKPLYYMALPAGSIAFASELQALEKVPGFDNRISLDAVAEVLSFQYIGAPRTIYENVHKLQPGHWMKLSADGTTETRRYFQFSPGQDLFANRSITDLADELEDILVRSLDRRMIADVPLGAFLSGGVDSSTTCALIRRRLNRPLKTYSIGFRGAPESEHEIAGKFAAHLGTEHHEELLEPQGADFLHHIGGILDEPNADSSCFPTYLLSRFARRHVTVAISGDGGDEMFGGYGRYFATLDEARQRGGNPGRSYYGERILVATEPHVKELLGFVPERFAQHLAELRAGIGGSGVLAAMRRSDVDNYMPGAVLPKVDRMSMQHSLEVRTPFLNVELARFAERLPDEMLVRNGKGKLILREIAYRYLPRELIDLPKQGFGLPMSDWAKNSLLGVASELLEGADCRLAEGIGRGGIDRFLARQRGSGGFSAYQVWAAAMLESWLRKHPVTWPSITRPETRSIASRRDALLAHAAGRGTWIVSRHASSLDDAINELSGPMRHQFLAIFAKGDRTDTTSMTLPLPNWTDDLRPEDIVRLRPLAGASIIFADAAERDQIDYHALARMLTLGVMRILVKNPYSTQKVDEIIIQSHRRDRVGLRILRLWHRKLAVFAKGRIARHGLRIEPLGQADKFRHTTPYVSELPVQRDQELAERYAVFEGTRQLPPLQYAHADIAERGGGRYSIYNNRLHVSTVTRTRRLTRPFWIVPINEETEAHLNFVPARRESSAETQEQAATRLQEYFLPTDGKDFRLRTGDRIVVFTHALPPGGAERQWVYLAQSLAMAGYNVTFVTYESLEGPSGHYLPLLQRSGIAIVDAASMTIHKTAASQPDIPLLEEMLEVCPFNDPSAFPQVISAFSMISPKVVFSQLDHPNIVAGFAARLLNIPRIVLSFRNYNPTNFPYIDNSSFLPSYRLLAKSGATRFTSNHTGSGDDYADWIGIDRQRVIAIPNAVDPDEFPQPPKDAVEQTRAALGLSPEDPIILGVFRLSAEKDPLGFVDTVHHVIRKLPTTKVLVTGVGPLQTEMEERLRKYGIAEKVKFLGRRDDVNVLMTIATLLLLTSTKEGMPNVVVEAQLMEIPVVATSTGATSEIVADGQTGYLRPVGDFEGLAQACLTLLADRCKAVAMGKAGRERTVRRYPKSALAERYTKALT
ncbi:asparagine synthase (glutamine-hydrolyzing) [Bradyrhizobium sp. LHD-71]|uniref:asparagine synthase (glutamine-hydrolyzing) n=1 Tax=Bradyrhizobium sp. LHD-71 TaxID=3072141 RepID=UPI00280D09B8|nr:asparagine synthase (glutamine-hydrolyzing) [Bradyrhizobium sp. LHD-71]MDQ8728354.1 asparagine synthase (glutamine-hydrolyzing) [Bradyrhizobium sp. LHD-71]